MKKTPLLAPLAIALGVGAYWMAQKQPEQPPVAEAGAPASALIDIQMPESLSDNARIGQRIFEANCAACHGANAVGRDGVAPPLVHVIYEPSHHGDESFQRAVAQGVREHHWPFGNMPPVEGLTRTDVAMIVAYVRELQRANGIN